MRMGRKIWLALALAVIVAVSFAAGAVAAKHKAASDPRPKTVTRGLDYFHARQKVDGAVRVFVAGTPRVDLLAKLYGYQDLVDGSPTKGSFSPSISTRTFQAVH